MKYVSFLFAVVLAAGVANAESSSFKFNYNNQNAYYSCDYAEAQVVKTLKAVGAVDVDTRCSGGIEHNQLWPVSVEAVYAQTNKSGATVTFKGNESCDFNVKLIKKVLETVGHEVIKSQSSCWDASGSYNYQVVLK